MLARGKTCNAIGEGSTEGSKYGDLSEPQVASCHVEYLYHARAELRGRTVNQSAQNKIQHPSVKQVEGRQNASRGSLVNERGACTTTESAYTHMQIAPSTH